MLSVLARKNVLLEKTTELFRLSDKDAPEQRVDIPTAGKWIWAPDVEVILSSGPLKNCTGGWEKRPFSTGRPPSGTRPAGPPEYKNQEVL